MNTRTRRSYPDSPEARRTVRDRKLITAADNVGSAYAALLASQTKTSTDAQKARAWDQMTLAVDALRDAREAIRTATEEAA